MRMGTAKMRLSVMELGRFTQMNQRGPARGCGSGLMVIIALRGGDWPSRHTRFAGLAVQVAGIGGQQCAHLADPLGADCVSGLQRVGCWFECWPHGQTRFAPISKGLLD